MVTAEGSFYILRFDRDAYNLNAKVEGAEITNKGHRVEETFEVVAEVSER
jgi:hypothetical protein